jgi:FK506-binding protein 1
MGVEKTVIKPGNGVDRPRKGDAVSMEYTGYLFDANKPENGFKGDT